MTIKKELEKATGVTKDSDESTQSYLGRVLRKVAALDDKDWDNLSKEAQAWYNTACAQANDKKELPDLGEDAPPPRATRARVEQNDEPEGPADPQVGDVVTITKTDGEKLKGELIEIDEKNVVILVDGEEEPLRRSKIKDIKVAGAGKADSKPAAKKAPEVGDVVDVITTETGEVKWTGKLLELDEKNAVVEVDGEEEVARLSRYTIVAKPGKADSKPAPRGKSDDAPAPRGKAEPAKKDPPKRGSETTRAREIIIENVDADKKAAYKLVCDELGDEAVKQVTFDMIYSDTHKTLAILKEKGMLSD